MTAVRSSHLRAVGFSNGVLTVAFHDGARYQWGGVSNKVYERLLKARSKGTFLRNHIEHWYGRGKRLEP